MAQLQHPIQIVARLSGLSPHVIRVWEKRYGAVAPARSDSNRRLYSDSDVERLRLLARAKDAGHRIGMIARLDNDELLRLVTTIELRTPRGPTDSVSGDERGGEGARPSEAPHGSHPRSGSSAGGPAARWDGATQLVTDALAATRAYGGEALQRVLEQGAVRFGCHGVLQRVVCPLAQEIGEHWERGEITAAHEHFASSVIREFLMRAARPYAPHESAPRAIVGTPAGQMHELGAVMAAAVAANLGWNPVILGASLPPAEIAGAALQCGARIVLLSIVHPADDPRLALDLVQLRGLLPERISIIAGGRAARAYARTLESIKAFTADDMGQLSAILGQLRDGDGEGGAAD